MNTVVISSNDKYLLLLPLQLMFRHEYATGSLPHRWCVWSKSHHSSISCSIKWLTTFTSWNLER